MKGKTKRVLQVLSTAVGSALVCVPLTELLLGDNITSVLMGGLLALYLTVRITAAVSERDVNGKLNIFAAVFIIILTVLVMAGLEKTCDPSYMSSTPGVEGVEEPTDSVARTDEGYGTEPSSAVSRVSSEESSPLVSSSASPELSSLPLEGEEEEISAASASETSSPSLQKVRVPDKPVFVSPASAVLVAVEDAPALESSESPSSYEEEEVSVPARVPEAPVFVSSSSAVENETVESGKPSVPSAPVFVKAESEAVAVSGEEKEEETTLSSPQTIKVTQTLVEVDETPSSVPASPSFKAVAVEEVRVPEAPVFAPSSSSLIPDAPSFGSDPMRSLVPEAPSFKAVSQTLEEIVVPVAAVVEEEEEDPWADFYFSDEDLSLEDGIYYFTLYVNDYYEGDIEVEVLGGEVFISAYELEAYIAGYLETESIDRIFSLTDEYYSSEYLSSVGVDVWSDTSFFECYIYLSSTDMPVTRISIKGSTSKSVTRPISGAVTVDPVNFYVISSYSLSASSVIRNGEGFVDNLSYSLSSSNSVRLWDLYGAFGWGVGGNSKEVSFSLGTYSFYKDIADKTLKLRFGNVSSDSFSPSGTPIGIRIDKQSTSSSSKKNDDERELLIEKDSDVVIYNQEREIFRKTLKAGKYIIQDFILYTGSNDIRIVVTPLDGSEGYEESFTIKYASSLLSPGEMYWGAAFAFSRQKVDSSSERLDWQVDIPFIFDKSLRYDITDFSSSAYVNIGIFDSLSGNFQIAVKGKRGVFSYRASAELTNMNALGTLRMNVNFSRSTVSSLYVRLSEQFSLSSKGFVRGLTISASYTKADLSAGDGYTVAPSLSLSGVAGMFGWSVGASGTLLPYSWESSTWMLTPSLSFSLGKLGISLSGTVSGDGSGNYTYSGRVSASLRIGGVSTTTSTNGKDTSLSASYSKNNVGVSANVRTSDIKDYRYYSYGLSLSSSTSLFSYGLSLSSAAALETINISGNMGFASVFAGGLFSFSSSVPSSFLLVKQKGALRGNTVSIATAGSSDSSVPSGYIGNILFRELPSSGASNISIYSQNDSGFSSGQSFDFFIADTETRGYVIVLEGEESYTVSGTVRIGEYIWRNGSSPLYSAEIDRNGHVTLEATEEYAFTDRNGVFILSDLKEGTYGFDVNYENRWYLYVIRVTDDLDPDLVTMVREKSGSDLTAPEVYEGVIETVVERKISSDEFWEELYGEV